MALAAASTTYDHKPAYPAHQTYDHQPSYKHKEYDYVSFSLLLKSNHTVRLVLWALTMKCMDYRHRLTTTSITKWRTTTPTSTSVTTKTVTETTPRDRTTSFCPMVAVKLSLTTLMVTLDTLLMWNTREKPNTTTNPPTNPLTNPNTRYCVS